MSGEKSVLSGNDGEKMMREFLKLVGWNNISQNVQFECNLGKKHKSKSSKSDRTDHNIDGTFYYNSPLNHAETDVILCSSKHNQVEYANVSQAYNHLKDLANLLECAPKDYEFYNDFENDDNKKKVFKGLLFWVSSNPDEQTTSMIEKISKGLINDDDDEAISEGKLRGIAYDSIYLVDNAKASFILGAIKTSQALHPNSRIQFLFPHTGSNNRSEDLKGYGDIMPIQYINTSILPIVIDDGDKVSVLIFCDSIFDKDYLKRIIWLAHKISELVGGINIYFNNYDKTAHEETVNRVKQLFQNSPLTSKITIRRIQLFDFVTLKEEQIERQIESNRYGKLRNVDILNGLPIENDLDRILPFGEMIKPIIASSTLSDTDVKAFLIRKGIYIGSREKQNTVPLLATLLLSPEELNSLKYLLKVKEDRIKSVPRSTSLKNSISEIKDISETINKVVSQSKSLVLPENCTFFKKPKIEILKNEIYIPFTLEKHNTTKDLITGKLHNEGSLIFSMSDNNLDAQINYTSRETYNYVIKLFKYFERALLDNNIITEEFYCIKFNSFSNTERIGFFLNFLSTQNETVFSEARLEQILVKPDSSLDEELPFDLESLKNKVNQLSITGQGLDTVHFFQDDYKKALLMQRVKIRYNFRISNVEGRCYVDLDFKNALSNGLNDAELVFNIEIIKKGSEIKDWEKVTQKLKKAFETIIQVRYKKFLSVGTIPFSSLVLTKQSD
ncbi:MAG: hypothetical protein QM541_15335 [Flavobacterium sp.]|nr:hypothetical protein [Flavobacterium sp.]